MYSIRFTYKGVMCKLVDTFDSFTTARKVADEYCALSGVTFVEVTSHVKANIVADVRAVA